MKKYTILLVVIFVAAVIIACGTSGMNCYSTFPGCNETAETILAITAAVATATAEAR